MKEIVIIGAGDLGREVVWLIEDINRLNPTYVILGFLDDDAAKLGGEFYGYRVLGGQDMLEKLSEKTPLSAVLAVQDGAVRKNIVEAHPTFSRWESIVHPSAVTAASSVIGPGCILFPQVTVSVDTKLGSFGLYYIHSTVCNDCIVGDYASVMTGAAVLDHSQLGDGCCLAPYTCVQPYEKREAEAAESAPAEDEGEE